MSRYRIHAFCSGQLLILVTVAGCAHAPLKQAGGARLAEGSVVMDRC
jgi:hypothetical protein